MTNRLSDGDAAEWADLLAVLAETVQEPTEELYTEIEDGPLGVALGDLTDSLALRPAAGTVPPSVSSLGAMTESYLRLFEAMETPYAPIAESPYRPWYGDRSGLMGGPPANDMTRRYEAIDAEFPDGYPPDHLALELEYCSFLLEAGAESDARAFVADHLDWVPALRQTVEAAAADAAFHRWAIQLADEVTVELRSRLEVASIPPADIEEMAKRVSQDTSQSRSF
ncbi:MAG: molecular chaperone [Halanaeroarchaeum sp.]